MATLTGKTIANTYKDLLQVSNNNSGVDTTVRTVSDGEGTNTALELSNAAVNINGTFQLNGESITVNASAINNMADIGGATGIIAVNSGNVYGRTLTAGTPVSITNANGAAGNPTITLASIANVSGSYGPFTNFGVNDYGQIVSATAVSTSVSIPTVRATELIAETLTLSSKASIVGELNVDGAFTVDGIVSAASDVAVSGSLYVTSNISVTGNTKTSFLQAVSASITDLTVQTFSYELVSVSALTANTITVTGTVSANALNTTGKVSSSAITVTGNVSAAAYYGSGEHLTNLSPSALTSVSAFTINQLTVVSAANITTGSAGSVTASTDADELVLESSGNTGMSILAAASGNAQIYFGEGTDNDAAFIQYNGSIDDLILSTTNAGSKLILKSDAGVTQLTLDGAAGSQFAEFANDIGLKSDSSKIYFGADNEITLTHTADTGLTLSAGSSGATANSAANTFVVEDNANAGISILSPDANSANLYFGSASDNNLAYLEAKDDAGTFKIGTTQTGHVIHFSSGNNSTALTIDASQRVGIGTTTPGSYESGAWDFVVGSGTASHGMTIRSNAANWGNIYFADGTTGTEKYRGLIQYNHGDDSLRLGTAGAGGKVILSSGGDATFAGAVDVYRSVSGGTEGAFAQITNSANSTNDIASLLFGVTNGTAGSSNYHKAGIFFKATGSSNVGQLILSANAANTSAAASTADAALTIEGSNKSATFTGNVAINTTLPTTAGSTGQLLIGDSGGIVTFDGETNYSQNVYYNSGWKYRTTDTASVLQMGNSDIPFRFSYTASGSADATASFTEAMQINGDGHVGIGVAADSTYALKVTNPGGNSYLQLYGATGYAAEFHAVSQNASGTMVVAMDNAGTGKIGTTIATPILFQTSGTEKMRLTAGGRLGVGQSDPQAVVDIVGNSDTVPALKIGANTTHGWEFYELATGGHFRLNRVVSDTSTSVLQIARDSGNITLTPASGSLLFGDTSKGIYYDGNDLRIYTTGTSDFITLNGETYVGFEVNSSTLMRLLPTGLHIGGTAALANETILQVTNSGDTSTIGTGTLALNNTNTTAGAGSAILFSSVEDTGANRRGVIEVISEGTQGGAMKFSTRDSVGAGSAWDEDTLILTGGNATFAGAVKLEKDTSAGASPITLELRATENSASWSTTADYAQLQFYSADASSPAGASVRASWGARMTGSTGGSSYLVGRVGGTDVLTLANTGDGTLTGDMKLAHDGAVLYFGADSEVNITHVADTGLKFNEPIGVQGSDIHTGGNVGLNLPDEKYVAWCDSGTNASAMGAFVQADSGALNFGGNAYTFNYDSLTNFNGDVLLAHDGAILKFGANSDVLATHVHDVGLDFSSTRNGADSIFRFKNSANASASDVRLIIQNGGTSGGDPLINFDGQATNATFSVGVDTSGTKFVIANADKGGFDGSDEKFTIFSDGDISIGTTANQSNLTVQGTAATDGVLHHNLNLVNVSGKAAGVGSGIMFGTNVGTYNVTGMAGIEGYSENATSDNYASRLGFYTRANGAALTEQLTIESTGAATFAASVVAKTVSSSHGAGNITLDFTANQNFILTLTGNISAVFADGSERVGESGIIVFVQDGTGSRTVSLSSDFSTVGGAGITLSTAANAVDVVPYFVQATDEILLGEPQKAFS